MNVVLFKVEFPLTFKLLKKEFPLTFNDDINVVLLFNIVNPETLKMKQLLYYFLML